MCLNNWGGINHKILEFHEYVNLFSGKSGSGKSTLMNILGLLDTCDSGTYMFSGLNTKTLADNELSRIRNERIGFIFQSFNLIPTLSVVENVALPLTYRGIPTAKRLERSLSALEAVGLSGRLSHKPYELSGGQQKRICIARALAADPDYIIFDEAVSGLDAAVRKSVLDLLIRIQKNSGKGFLLITHDIDAALYTSQRIAVMKSGRILETVKYSGDIKVFESEYAKILINSSLSGIKKQDISAKSG